MHTNKKLLISQIQNILVNLGSKVTYLNNRAGTKIIKKANNKVLKIINKEALSKGFCKEYKLLVVYKISAAMVLSKFMYEEKGYDKGDSCMLVITRVLKNPGIKWNANPVMKRQRIPKSKNLNNLFKF